MKRFLALTFIATWLAAGALDAYHLAHANHVACPAHGDVVEGALDHEELGDGFAQGEHGDVHHHCDASVLQLAAATLVSPANARLVSRTVTRSVVIPRAPSAAADQLWLQAPKQSPPRV